MPYRRSRSFLTLRDCKTYIATLAFFATLVISTSSQAGNISIDQSRTTGSLKPNEQYYVRITCTARNRNSAQISQKQMLTYMRGLDANGNYSAKNRGNRNTVLHTLTITESKPTLTGENSSPVFSAGTKTAHIPVFYAKRDGRNRLEQFVDGTSICPDKLFFIGNNDYYLTNLLYHTNKSNETPALADVAQFLTEAWPNFRLVAFSNFDNEKIDTKFEKLSPLSTAITKLLNAWKNTSEINSPIKLKQGTTIVTTSLSNVTVNVTKYNTFLRSKAPFRANLEKFIPTDGLQLDFSDIQTTTTSCLAASNTLKRSGLVSKIDRAYILFQKSHDEGVSEVDVIRCLGPTRLAPFAADSNYNALFSKDADMLITTKDIHTFERNYPEEIPRKQIIDKRANEEEHAAQRAKIDRTIRLLIHRTRLSSRFEDMTKDVQNYYRDTFAPLLTLRDETETGWLNEISAKDTNPYKSLKALAEIGLERFGCLTENDTETKKFLGEDSFAFLAFQEPYQKASVRGENPPQLKNAVAFHPRFNIDNKIAELVAYDQFVDKLVTANTDCSVETSKSK